MLAREVFLAELDVGQIHRETACLDERGKRRVVELGEPVDDFDRTRGGMLHGERLARIERRLARLDRVDDVALHSLDVGIG